MPKSRIEASIESTMVGPLWTRATYSKLYPEILEDPQAELILNEVFKMYPEDHEGFEPMKEFIDEFAGLSFILRARKFDDEIREFEKEHLNATIVNLGCGLDTPNLRIGNPNLT